MCMWNLAPFEGGAMSFPIYVLHETIRPRVLRLDIIEKRLLCCFVLEVVRIFASNCAIGENEVCMS